jgi:group I intron endonuclease
MVILHTVSERIKINLPCIYFITNKINGKQYIGQTIDPFRRWKEHQSPTADEFAVQHAFIKYGNDNFIFQIIEQPATENDLNEAERWWIAHQRSLGRILYNETDGGDGIRGYHHTENDKKRMSEIRLALIASGWTPPKHTEEWKTEVSQNMIGHKRNVGKVHSPDCGHCQILRERNANNNPALKMTIETKKKMSDKKKGSKNNNAIMTEEKIIELRQLAEQGINNAELSKLFGISRTTVNDIRNYRSWKHIP